MAVLMQDTACRLTPEARVAYDKGDLADITFAADTLLLGISDRFLAEFLEAVVAAGSRYEMDMHCDMLQLPNVQCDLCTRLPDGSDLFGSRWANYSGTVLAESGHIVQRQRTWPPR